MLRATTNIMSEYPGATVALTAGVLALAVFGTAPAAYAAVAAVFAARLRSAS